MNAIGIHCSVFSSRAGSDPVWFYLGGARSKCHQTSLKPSNWKHRSPRRALHDRHSSQQRNRPCDTVFREMSSNPATADCWVSIFKSPWINERRRLKCLESFPGIRRCHRSQLESFPRCPNDFEFLESAYWTLSVKEVLKGETHPILNPPKSKMTARSREWSTRKLFPWNPRSNS